MQFSRACMGVYLGVWTHGLHCADDLVCRSQRQVVLHYHMANDRFRFGNLLIDSFTAKSTALKKKKQRVKPASLKSSQSLCESGFQCVSCSRTFQHASLKNPSCTKCSEHNAPLSWISQGMNNVDGRPARKFDQRSFSSF